MSVNRLLAFTCGWQTGPFRGVEEPPVRVPTPAYLIEHSGGLALVDTGLHPDMGRDAKARVGWPADFVVFELADDEHIAARLERAGVDAGALRFLVSTHLHFDHCGGNELIPASVPVVIQRREWEAGHDEAEIEANFYVPADYDGHGRDVLAVEGEHDLFGDGSVILFPTYGHTPGHQSLRVRLESGEVVLCGDGCYFQDWIDTEESPPHGRDKAEELRSLRKLRRLRDGGARLFPGHDPAFWATVPQAPAAIR